MADGRAQRAAGEGADGGQSGATASLSRLVRHPACRAVGLVVGVGLLAALVAALVRGHRQLPPEALRISGWVVAAAVALCWGGNAACALQWRVLMRALGADLTRGEALRIHWLVQLWKYIPGKIMLLVGKAYLCVRQGISAQRAALGVAYEQVFILASAAFVVLFCGVAASRELLRDHVALILACAVAGVACLHPRVMRFVLAIVSRIVRAEGQLRELSYGESLALIGRYAVYWVFQGAAVYVLAWALADLPLMRLPYCIGMTTLATVLGFLAVVIPAGLGVRDGIITAMLSLYMPAPLAIAASLAYRVVVTVAELLGVATALLLSRRRRPVAAAPSLSPCPRVTPGESDQQGNAT